MSSARTMIAWTGSVLVCAAAFVFACSAFDATTDPSSASTDATAAVDVQTDGQSVADGRDMEAASPESGSDSDSAAAPSDGGCAAARGPQGVRAGSYCIDSTEVTWAQYLGFTTAIAGGAPTQPSFCAFNSTFTPACQPPANPALPVTCVDWCDAYAFCSWAGKHLCGRVGDGGPVPLSNDGIDPTKDEWYGACATPSLRTYPYGSTHEAGVCNDQSSAAVAAGAYPACVGGYPGLFDMSGNVNEWEDSCGAYAGQSDPCRCRGGSYNSPNSPACADVTCGVSRGSTYPDLGFRCCFEP